MGIQPDAMASGTPDTWGPPARPHSMAVADTVRLIRDSRGVKIKELADSVGVSAGYVSKVENSQTMLTGTMLEKFAAALQVRPELLCRPVPAQSDEGIHFRSQSRTPQWIRKKAIADANLAGYALNRMLDTVSASFPRVLPDLDAAHLHGNAREAAQLVRAQWRLDGPITDLVGEMEAAGVFVLPMPEGIDSIDAVTVRTHADATAVILLRHDVGEDRQRHTLAHELGHLVMDLRSPHPSVRDVEDRADAFAGEFLAPYEEIRPHLVGITPSRIEVLTQLKARWGVSVPALIRRAYLAGDLNETQYRYWFRVLNARGLVRDAGGSSYPVRPCAAADLLQALKADGYAAADLVGLTGFTLADLQRLFGDAWPGRRLRPRLSLLPAPDQPTAATV